MRRLLAAAALAPAIVAAPASGTGFGELPLQLVTPVAGCVRATGAPGEYVRWTPRGALVAQAGASASTPIPLGGDVSECPAAAGASGGAAVVAAPLRDGGLVVALREPGGGFAAPVRVTPAHPGRIDDLAAAVSPRGDAVVAWLEHAESRTGKGAITARVARRTPGGALGAPETLATWTSQDVEHARIVAGLDAAGDATVVWSQPNPPTRSPFSSTGTAHAVLAPPGAPFGAPQQLSDSIRADVALAVAPDGRALVVLPGRELDVEERPPGAAAFGAPQRLSGSGGDAAVALRADGAAVVAWNAEFAESYAALRPAGGAFGPPLPLEEPEPQSGFSYAGSANAIIGGGAAESVADPRGGALRAAFAGDGRAFVTWGGSARSFGVSWTAAQVATEDGDAFAPPQRLGGPLRDAGSIAPVTMPAGQPAVVWTDDDPPGAGHVHTAVEGAAAAAQGAFPRVTAGKPRRTVIPAALPLELPLTCSAACDVRAVLASGVSATASRPSAGSAVLRLGGDYSAVAPVRPRPVKVILLFGPPGATAVHRRTLSLRLRRPTPPPVPRLLSVSAVHRGGVLIVEWTTDRSSRGFSFDVTASSERSFGSSASTEQSGAAKRRFSYTFESFDRPATFHFVRVTVKFDHRRMRSKTVRVTRGS